MRIDLPWPSRKLSPNSRTHWAAKASAAKKARRDAAFAAASAGVRRLSANKISVTAIYAPPDRRRHDKDNLISRSKAAFDGIADAIGVDDSRWELAVRTEPPVRGGNLRIEIEVLA